MGGTGTYPFLVGLAWWEGGGLEVEQLFMREYREERSVLAACTIATNEVPPERPDHLRRFVRVPILQICARTALTCARAPLAPSAA